MAILQGKGVEPQTGEHFTARIMDKLQESLRELNISRNANEERVSHGEMNTDNIDTKAAEMNTLKSLEETGHKPGILKREKNTCIKRVKFEENVEIILMEKEEPIIKDYVYIFNLPIISNIPSLVENEDKVQKDPKEPSIIKRIISAYSLPELLKENEDKDPKEPSTIKRTISTYSIPELVKESGDRSFTRRRMSLPDVRKIIKRGKVPRVQDSPTTEVPSTSGAGHHMKPKSSHKQIPSPKSSHKQTPPPKSSHKQIPPPKPEIFLELCSKTKPVRTPIPSDRSSFEIIPQTSGAGHHSEIKTTLKFSHKKEPLPKPGTSRPDTIEVFPTTESVRTPILESPPCIELITMDSESEEETTTPTTSTREEKPKSSRKRKSLESSV